MKHSTKDTNRGKKTPPRRHQSQGHNRARPSEQFQLIHVNTSSRSFLERTPEGRWEHALSSLFWGYFSGGGRVQGLCTRMRMFISLFVITLIIVVLDFFEIESSEHALWKCRWCYQWFWDWLMELVHIWSDIFKLKEKKQIKLSSDICKTCIVIFFCSSVDSVLSEST